MPTKTTPINRAPVLTLWAAVVAQRLGFAEDEALNAGESRGRAARLLQGPEVGTVQTA
jgi:hypothetical protein